MNESQTQQVLEFIKACDRFNKVVPYEDEECYDIEYIQFLDKLKDLKQSLNLI